MSVFSFAAQPNRQNQNILRIVGWLLAALLAYEAAQYILTENYTDAVYAAMAVVGFAIAVTVLKDWRKGIYPFLGWLLFEDLVRKYMGNNMLIYFAKDALALILFLSFFVAFRKKQVRGFRPPFLVALLVFVWLGVAQIFNPNSPHLVFGLMGFKLYYFYIPLLFVGYGLFDSEIDLRRFFFVNLALADAIAALGVAQSILGHTFLNPEVPAEDLRELSTLYRSAPISGLTMYRPTSVFVSDGRFATYMTLSLILAFGFAGYLLLRTKKGRLFSIVSLAIISVAALLSASRGTIMWCMMSLIAGSVAFLWGAPWKQGEARRVVRIISRTAGFIGVAVVITLILYPDALLSRVAFYSETLSPYSSQSELSYRALDYPFKNFLDVFKYPQWPWGYGIGTCSLGVQYVARFFKVAPPIGGVENGYGTLILEFGIAGLLVWLFLTAAISKACLKVVRMLKGTPWFPLAFMIFWFVFLLLVPFTYGGMVSYQNFVMNAYLWLLIGILLRIPTLPLSVTAPGTASERR